MKKIAKFEKVSYENFEAAFSAEFGTITDIHTIYANIKLPKRATMGSAGYDFFTPCDITLAPSETVKIPTGVRAWIENGWVLKLYPRSGLGFKFRLQLNNSWYYSIYLFVCQYFFEKNLKNIHPWTILGVY